MFSQLNHEYLIEQVQYQGSESHNSGASLRLRTSFSHPVKEVIWVPQPNAYVIGMKSKHVTSRVILLVTVKAAATQSNCGKPSKHRTRTRTRKRKTSTQLMYEAIRRQTPKARRCHGEASTTKRLWVRTTGACLRYSLCPMKYTERWGITERRERRQPLDRLHAQRNSEGLRRN
jgi:hypothetical protein